MLKQNGAFSAVDMTSGMDVRRGTQQASQQVRQYDITPPPVMIVWGDRWLKLTPPPLKRQVSVVPIVTSPVFPMARALAPDILQYFRYLGFLAPVKRFSPSCPLG